MAAAKGNGENPGLGRGLLLVLGLLMTVNPVAANMYLAALGLMAADLGTTIAGAQFALTGFLLGVAFGQLIVGALADSLGRRRVLLAGLTLLTLASIEVALAPSIELLVAGRVVQGLGAAASVVVARAIVADIATEAQKASAFSLLMGMLAVGPLIAPLLGTLLMQAGGWRPIFVGLVVISSLYLFVAWRTVPETLRPERRTPVRFTRLLGNYRRLAGDGAYVGNALAMALGFAAMSVHVSASSFIAQDVLGTDEWGFSLLYICYAAAVMLGSWANAPLSTRFGARRMLVVAQAIAIASTAALVVFAATGALNPANFVISIVLASGAGSAILANATTLAVGRAAFAAGSGAALMGFTQFALGSLISPVGGVAGPHTAVPMAVAMCACFAASLLAGAAGSWWERRRPAPPADTR
ncbi:Bcr/CflA family drug resistance efflux transporter [Pseudoclavibacter endophyticus]|nr:Bcr/CflA family drug resistance efflux transporter [Pseudoclavibacter endophyticus]